MFSGNFRKIAVSLSFFLGTLAASAVVLAYLSVFGGLPAGGSAEPWAASLLTLVAVATLSGLIVDAIRFIAAHSLPHKLPYQLKLRKILKRHLA